MHRKYHDILRHADRLPIWWHEGVPRFEPFEPGTVGYSEVALVHTRCQDCLTRYDVAVTPSAPLFHRLRDIIAYTNSLEIGDPPFACTELGAKHFCAGYCMSSLEIEVLEFWHKPDQHWKSPWQRDPSLEKPLIDYEGEAFKEHPVLWRIQDSEKREDWKDAWKAGDLARMEEFLSSVGCQRSREVAKMIDLDRRQDDFRKQIMELRRQRSE